MGEMHCLCAAQLLRLPDLDGTDKDRGLPVADSQPILDPDFGGREGLGVACSKGEGRLNQFLQV